MPSGDEPTYKLTYFAVRGLGEPIRLLFHYKSIPFEDNQIKRFTEDPECWKALKPTTPYGTLPTLEWVECSGDSCELKVLGQSQTICRFLAKKYGLTGKDEWEAAKTDELGEWLKDIWRDYIPYFMVAVGMQEGDKKKKYDEVFVPLMKDRFVPVLLRELKNSGSGFLVSSGITWVDFMVVCSVTTFKNFDEEKFLSQHKELDEYEQKVYSASEGIKKYVEERPKMEF